ncbi:MAG: inositol monophosphatase family protein [Ilumatobacteraceae bacterium]
MTADDPGELRDLATRLARAAGTLALEGRRSVGTGTRVAHDTKSTATDPVTEFDRAAEELLVGELTRSRPDDAIVGEEGTSRPGTSGLEWHLDPIDGTVNFVYDLPLWSTSVGVVDERGPMAGAVYAPAIGEMFAAARGGGATLDGEPLAASETTDLSTSLVATGFNYDPAVRHGQGIAMAEMLTRIRDVRRLGSAALDLCFVAAGRYDAYFEEHLNSWDIAAGLLIATEAGATASDYTGARARPSQVVVAAPGIHTELLAIIAESTR